MTTRRKFAFLPVELYDGHIVWLTWYLEMHNPILPNGHNHLWRSKLKMHD